MKGRETGASLGKFGGAMGSTIIEPSAVRVEGGRWKMIRERRPR